MRQFYLTLIFTFCCMAGAWSQTKMKMSILGDSYSTFYGYVTPATNKCFYKEDSKHKNDVRRVEDTWWWLLANEMDYDIDVNNSYSGATVCNTGYAKNNYTDRSFVTRSVNIGEPDILFIFGGTNDYWAKSPVGEYVYTDWTKKSLFSFRPAFSYILSCLMRRHPKMRIINIIDPDLGEDFKTSMTDICDYYKVECVVLPDSIEKKSDHPSIAGMRKIADHLEFYLNTTPQSLMKK